jgi:hypothetical protein
MYIILVNLFIQEPPMTRSFSIALFLSVSAIALCVAVFACSKQSERERLEKEIAVARETWNADQAAFKKVLDTVRDPNAVRVDCSVDIVPCVPGLPRIVAGKDSGSCVSRITDSSCHVLPQLKKMQDYRHSQPVYIESRAKVERSHFIFDSLYAELKKLSPDPE